MKTPKQKQQIITWSIRVLSMLLLALIVAAVILYQKGYYDFTFIERPIKEATEVTEKIESDVATADTQELGTTVPDNETVAPETEAPTDPHPTVAVPSPSTTTAKEVLGALPLLSDAQTDGYTAQSGGTYDASSWVIAKMPFDYDGTKYAYSRHDVRGLRVTEYNRTCIVTSEVTKSALRPAIMARNGYLIVDNGDKTLSLYDENGDLLLEAYDEETYALTDLRTADGKAIFMQTTVEIQMLRKPIYTKDPYTGRPKESGEYEEKESKCAVKVYTYYTLNEDGTWKKLDIASVNEAKRVGVIYDAPTDYGKSDCDIEVYASAGGDRFGYRNKTTGKPIVYAMYVWAREFHDGYGVCFNGRELVVYNEQGEKVYSVGCHEPEIFFTANEVTFPDTNGLEALGCYYFDHGLMRVRMRPNLVTYMTYYYIKTADYNTLIDIRGNEFQIPGGYTLESYSDGVLLLKKQDEELYGYMNYKGDWIVQPEYSYARPFVMGLGVIGDKDGKKGIVNTEGAFVVPMTFDKISDISKGTIALYDTSVGWSVLRLMAK